MGSRWTTPSIACSSSAASAAEGDVGGSYDVLGKNPDGALAVLQELRQVDSVSTLDATVAEAQKRLKAAEQAKRMEEEAK